MVQKILITGANGMLGSSLCRLYQEDNQVYANHRDSQCYAPCTYDFSLNLLNLTKLKKIYEQIKPDIIIHCAGLINVDGCEKAPGLAYGSNVIITENIAKVCHNDTKLVYISTDQVYGNTDDHSETNGELQQVNQYGKTKYLGEQKVEEHCPDCIIIRTNIFGWNAKSSKVSSAEWIYYSLKKGKEITLFFDYTFSPIYTEYLGEIIMQLVGIDFSGVINIGSPSPCSKFDFGTQLAEEFRFDKSLVSKGSIADHSFGAPRANNLVLNTKRLTSLGITAPDYGRSIKKFRKNKLGL